MPRLYRFSPFLSAFLSVLLTGSLAFGQRPKPAPPQSGPRVVYGGTIHVGDGATVVENGFVRFEEGKVTAVGPVAEADTSGAEVLYAEGKHVYPGLILVNNTLGITEIGSVRATHDYDETGELTPNVRSLVAYNTDSRLIPTVRANGVLLCQVAPRGDLLPGTSSVVHLDAWNWEDAAYAADDAVYMNMPAYFYESGWWAAPGPTKPNTKHDEQMRMASKFFKDAYAYCQNESPEKKNLKFEAVRGLFDGSKRLFVEANYAREILEAVQFAKGHKIQKVVITGGAEAWRVAGFLKENDVPVALQRTFSLPMQPHDDIAMPFKQPKILSDAGVRFCLSYVGDMEAMGSRNLPFAAGQAVAYGLSKEKALAAVTSGAADVLGIADRCGTLEVGKDAHIVVSEGDLLDMRTSKVTRAFISGRDIALHDWQRELYERYSEKYGQEIED